MRAAFVAHDFRKHWNKCREYRGHKFKAETEPVPQFHGLFLCDTCGRITYRASYRPLNYVYPCGLEGCAGEKWRQ